MLEFTSKTIKQWSRRGPRATYGAVLMDLIENNDKVYALSADLGTSSGFLRIMNQYPDRYVNTGIAEQNLIGVSAGFAKLGLIPFASSFAPFITHRCADQIRMNMGYMKLGLKIVGLGSGISMSYLGYSHYGIEDIAMLRSIPNITILSPADCGELVKSVYAAAEYDGPVYIRLTGEPGMPIVYNDEFDFKIGKANIIKDDGDILIIATGSMVSEAIKTAELFKQQNVNCKVIDMHTVKPLDYETIELCIKDTKAVVTMEEHSIIGGLGSAVAEYLADNNYNIKFFRFGLKDEYLKAGSYPYMKEQYGLTAVQMFKCLSDELL